MSDETREFTRDREDFLCDGTVPGSVREEIAVSWRRCLGQAVPAEGIAPRYVPDIDPESLLLRAAGPVLDQVAERLGDLGISFLLTDAAARIIDRRTTNPDLLGRLDSVSAATGFVFAEGDVGTNGVGTAIELRRPVRVDGAEHYAEELRQFTCVGVPIRGADRRLHGLLDVSSVADHHNTVIGLLAEQTAERIEQRLVASQSAGERALLDRFLAASRQGRDFFVVSDRVLITSPRAARLLEGVEQALLWEHVSRLLADRGEGGTRGLPLADGRVLMVRVEALRDGGDRIGAIVEVRSEPGGGAEPACGTGRPGALPGLSGADPGWLRACADAAGAVPRRLAVLCGEPGVGKLAVARGVHQHHGGGRFVVHEAATMSTDGPSCWLDALRTDLGEGCGTVAVWRVDGLSPVAARGVTALLHSARRRGWRCLVTATGSTFDIGSAVGDEDVSVVELPPLRDRMGDVPALARGFATPRRLAPDVVSLLLRLPWPGNTRTLRLVVEQARARAGGPEIGLTDLPARLRAAAFRPTMSRFERAELNAILDALAEADGNKKTAAALLGISRSTLYRKLEAAGLERPG